VSLAPGVRLGVYETLRERIVRSPIPLDDRQVAVVHNDDNRIRILTLATGEERVLTVKEWRGFETIAWTSNGASLRAGSIARRPLLSHRSEERGQT